MRARLVIASVPLLLVSVAGCMFAVPWLSTWTSRSDDPAELALACRNALHDQNPGCHLAFQNFDQARLSGSRIRMAGWFDIVYANGLNGVSTHFRIIFVKKPFGWSIDRGRVTFLALKIFADDPVPSPRFWSQCF